MTDQYWKYYPHCFSRKTFIPLLAELENYCEYYNYNIPRHKEQLLSKRKSCVVTDQGTNVSKSTLFKYDDIPTFIYFKPLVV